MCGEPSLSPLMTIEPSLIDCKDISTNLDPSEQSVQCLDSTTANKNLHQPPLLWGERRHSTKADERLNLSCDTPSNVRKRHD